MPIANCIVFNNCQHNSTDLVELWAGESGQSAEHMTVNVVDGSQQYGIRYSVVATLWLPSIWSKPDVSSLQLGLARALAKFFDLAASEIHITTQKVDSGNVVESGQEIEW